MQSTSLNESTLEEFYAQVILPQFGIRGQPIVWESHQAIGPDNNMHILLSGDRQLVLVFDDYPTTTLRDIQAKFAGKKVKVLPRVSNDNVKIDSRDVGLSDDGILRFGPSETPFQYTHNVTGYFSLYEIEVSAKDIARMKSMVIRQVLKNKSRAYSALLDLGFEILSIAHDEAQLGHVVHMAWSAHILAGQYEFDDLASFFFDFSEDADLYPEFGLSYEQFLAGQKRDLRDLATAAHINPGATARDKELVDTYTLPIHAKMVKKPDESPAYFLELADTLDRLIRDEGLTEWAAAEELSYALDRPQILADTHLQLAIQKAYDLELSGTLRQHNPRERWDEFYELLKKTRST